MGNPASFGRMKQVVMGIAVAFALMVQPAATAATARIGDSVVRVQATQQPGNYRVPWTPGRVVGGVGAGFVVEGNRIMTNAHVVSDARFLTVSRQDDPKPYTARVLHVAHDCDLALLSVDDETFFQASPPLEFGGIPQIESTVSVYGYPIGGDRLSVTRGVVSRIDFLPYSHTGVDAHLTIQIDAAINPGNSGGPVLQDGKVVGVAFQGFSGDVAQNVGYMIPTPVILRFLQDVETGSYDHYMDLALTYHPLFNPAARRALGVGDAEQGVLVGSVFGGGSGDGKIKPGDVLLTIDGLAIASDGSVMMDGERVEMAEVVERKFKGDTVLLELLRDGQPLAVELDLLEFPFKLYARAYDEKPRYVVFGGLVFQPVNRNFMEDHNPGNMRLRHYFDRFLSEHIYREHPELVVLSGVLADPINSYAADFRHNIVEAVNGKRITSLDDIAAAFDEPAEFYVIELLGEGRPIVLESGEVEAARERILERYGVARERNLES